MMKFERTKTLFSVTIGLVFCLFLFRFYKADEYSCEIFVYGYSSLTSPMGLGKDLQVLFQEQTGCHAHLENIGDARTLLQRLISEVKIKGTSDADVVLGLDQFSVQEAHQELEWHQFKDHPLSISGRLNQVGLSQDDLIPFQSFIPFDWSPMTFIYKTDANIPSFKNLQDIFGSQVEYALMDPRSSSPGFQFLVWILNDSGEHLLSDFIEKALLISPSWTTAYGLFTKGQTQIAFSYLTSLAYHWREEKDREFQAMRFESGHPYQIEFAGVVADSPRLKMAIEFVRFLHTKQVQKLIMEENYMFPVIPGVEEATVFAELTHLPLISDYGLKYPASQYLESWKKSLK